MDLPLLGMYPASAVVGFALVLAVALVVLWRAKQWLLASRRVNKRSPPRCKLPAPLGRGDSAAAPQQLFGKEGQGGHQNPSSSPGLSQSPVKARRQQSKGPHNAASSLARNVVQQEVVCSVAKPELHQPSIPQASKASPAPVQPCTHEVICSPASTASQHHLPTISTRTTSNSALPRQQAPEHQGSIAQQADMGNTSASLQPQDLSLHQLAPAQSHKQQALNSTGVTAGAPYGRRTAEAKPAAGSQDDTVKARADLAADSASSMHPPALVGSASALHNTSSSQTCLQAVDISMQNPGKGEGVQRGRTQADSRSSSLDVGGAAPTSKDSHSSQPPSPAAAASKKEAPAGDSGKVPVKEKKQNKIASIGSSLLATIREKSGSAGLTKNDESKQSKAMFSSKDGEKRALFRTNKVLPTPTMYALVHPKPSGSASVSSDGRPPPMTPAQVENERRILEERAQREKEREERERESARIRAERERLKSVSSSGQERSSSAGSAKAGVAGAGAAPAAASPFASASEDKQQPGAAPGKAAAGAALGSGGKSGGEAGHTQRQSSRSSSGGANGALPGLTPPISPVEQTTAWADVARRAAGMPAHTDSPASKPRLNPVQQVDKHALQQQQQPVTAPVRCGSGNPEEDTSPGEKRRLKAAGLQPLTVNMQYDLGTVQHLQQSGSADALAAVGAQHIQGSRALAELDLLSPHDAEVPYRQDSQHQLQLQAGGPSRLLSGVAAEDPSRAAGSGSVTPPHTARGAATPTSPFASLWTLSAPLEPLTQGAMSLFNSSEAPHAMPGILAAAATAASVPGSSAAVLDSRAGSTCSDLGPAVRGLHHGLRVQLGGQGSGSVADRRLSPLAYTPGSTPFSISSHPSGMSAVDGGLDFSAHNLPTPSDPASTPAAARALMLQSHDDMAGEEALQQGAHSSHEAGPAGDKDGPGINSKPTSNSGRLKGGLGTAASIDLALNLPFLLSGELSVSLDDPAALGAAQQAAAEALAAAQKLGTARTALAAFGAWGGAQQDAGDLSSSAEASQAAAGGSDARAQLGALLASLTGAVAPPPGIGIGQVQGSQQQSAPATQHGPKKSMVDLASLLPVDLFGPTDFSSSGADADSSKPQEGAPPSSATTSASMLLQQMQGAAHASAPGSRGAGPWQAPPAERQLQLLLQLLQLQQTLNNGGGVDQNGTLDAQWLVQQLQRVQQQQQLQQQAAVGSPHAGVDAGAAYMAATTPSGSQYSTPQKHPAGNNAMYLSPSAAASPAAHRISNTAWGPAMHQHPQMSPRQTMGGWVWHDVGSPHPAVGSPAAVQGRQHTPRGTSSPLMTAGGSSAGAQVAGSPAASSTTPISAQPAPSPGRALPTSAQSLQQQGLLLSPTGATQLPANVALTQFSPMPVASPHTHSSSGVAGMSGGSAAGGTLPSAVLGSPGAVVPAATQQYIVSPGPNGMLTLIPATSYLVPGQMVALPPGSQIMTLASSPGASGQVPVGTIPGGSNLVLVQPPTMLGSPIATHSGSIPIGMPGVGVPMAMGGMLPHGHHMHHGQPGTPRMPRPLYETSLTAAVVSVKHAGAPAVPPPTAAGTAGTTGGATSSTAAPSASSPQQQAAGSPATTGGTAAPSAAASVEAPVKAGGHSTSGAGAATHSSHGSHGSGTHAPPTPTVSKVLISHNQSGRSSSNSSMTGPAALVVPSTPSASPHCPSAAGRALLSPTTPSGSTAHDLQLSSGQFGHESKTQDGVSAEGQ